jgi:predicted DNA-binding transcriptional regulator AlpA
MKQARVIIGSGTYVTATEIIQTLGISRQTLWRWRQDGRIPPGSKYKERVLVFTETEAALIRDFAERIVPAGVPQSLPRGRSRT